MLALLLVAKFAFFDACIGSQLLYCLHTAWLNKAFLRKLDGLSSPMFAQNPWTQPRVQRGGFETGCGQGLLRFLLWTSCGFVFSSCVFLEGSYVRISYAKQKCSAQNKYGPPRHSSYQNSRRVQRDVDSRKKKQRVCVLDIRCRHLFLNAKKSS